MKPDKSLLKSTISLILTATLLLPAFAIPVFSQSRPIVITFGQPNIWSLEQAHYLLSRMHRQNLDLQTARLGDLDPNATNASRIDILKTLLSAGVSFDQAVGLNNQLLRNDRTFNSQRRQELLGNRTTLQAESTQLAREISALKIAKSTASTPAERDQIQSNIDAKTEEKAAVDNQLTQTNDELKGLTSASGEFKSAEVSNDFSSKDLAGDLDTLMSRVQLINPSIAATLRLDNHIQLQYEIISKQLTLLRDEVGPGERLVFLELPQSINATQDRAENKMAQTWWRIAGYTQVDNEWLLQHELEELATQIHSIDLTVKDNDARITSNRTNKNALINQLNELCKKQRELEVLRNNTDEELAAANRRKDAATRALEKAKTLADAAKKALDKAIESGGQNEIAVARQRLAAEEANAHPVYLQKNAVYLQEQLVCAALQKTLAELTESLEQLEKVIGETRRAIQKIDDQELKLQRDRARLVQAFTSLSTKYEKLRFEKVRDKIREQQDAADRMLQGGSARTYDVIQQTFEMLEREKSYGVARLKTVRTQTDDQKCAAFKEAEFSKCKSRRFVDLEEQNSDKDESKKGKSQKRDAKEKDSETTNSQTTGNSAAILKRRFVRTVDIIPRQNAINVHDTKQTVSKTGIFAAVSFLFGFAGKFTYERQREHAEQFLNQELFTSGFGKGEKVFGWSFYPFAGTRQLSSGVRTTYAVAIIPDDAESIVLKARGCYFPRKDNQPDNYDETGKAYWQDDDELSKRSCTSSEQVFVVPVPGGTGDGADYYVTGLRYAGNRGPGERMIATIQGQNLPSQAGILINGVPLREAVGLGQLNIEAILDDSKTRDNCVGDICGRFERIDSHEIVISFRMPNDFNGTPRIGVIGPGKTIELNKLFLTINGDEDTQLDSADMMFGDPPDSTLRRITDFRVSPPQSNSTDTLGVLTGSRFKPGDTYHVNGQQAQPQAGCRSDLCILKFPTQTADFLTVTITPTEAKEKAVSKTFVNPTNLSIISASAVNYTPPEGSRPGFMTVKLDGSGFKPELRIELVGGNRNPDRTIPSSGQMFLKIVDPEQVVQITITDSSSNRTVNAVVVRPDPPPKEKK